MPLVGEASAVLGIRKLTVKPLIHTTAGTILIINVSQIDIFATCSENRTCVAVRAKHVII